MEAMQGHTGPAGNCSRDPVQWLEWNALTWLRTSFGRK